MIKVLDRFIAEKIAAGEVIERPVSAVKELVENSVDAGSSSIIIEIREGGKSYIRVTDNGSGIAPEEVELAFQRHATSKISSLQDLDNIQSLGFRGEALASIAAISRLTIVTRTADLQSGTKLMMHGGRLISKEITGANIGTTIVVENLFYNVPARRKFMGSDAREASAIMEVVQHYAICYASIRFMLIKNGETIFTTSGDGNTHNAIRTIYPGKEYAELIKLEAPNISGYISSPGVVKPNRKSQLFFVNKRLVDSPVIEKAIDKGYAGRIFSGFPIAILFIDVSPSELDVNIHPGKRQVKFLNQDAIVSNIAQAIENALRVEKSIPSLGENSKSEKYPNRASATYVEVVSEQSSIRDYLSNISKVPDTILPVDELNQADKPFDFVELRYAGYVFSSYIIMQSREAIYLFDQHAAHERINYEKYINAYNLGDRIPQPILTPFVMNFSRDVYEAGLQALEPLSRMGYDISDFGDGSFVVRGIPSYVTIIEAEAFLKAYIEASSEELHDYLGGNITVIDKLIMRSCKASVKAGDHLSQIEIDRLIADLSACKNPYSCPHGRPTFIRITEYEIERSFERK